MCECADTLLAGNAFLADNAASPRVVVVPTVVEPADYSVADHTASGAGARLTWIGSGSTLQGLTRIGDQFAAIDAAVPGIKLRLVCDQGVELPGVGVRVGSLVARDGRTESLAAADIGVQFGYRTTTGVGGSAG